MDRMKTFLKYALWIVVFFIFSELLINVGLNSSYKDMTAISSIDNIKVEQAQSTLINGRIKGIIENNEQLIGKYIKFDFYSKRNNLTGSKYVKIEPNTSLFEFYFELQDITSYDISITNKIEGEEIKILPKDLSKGQIILGTLMAMMIIW